MPFQKGHKLATGGKREGSGRKPDEIKKIFQDILVRSGALDRLEEILKTTTDNDVFLKAFALTADRGYGKAPQPVEATGLDGGPIVVAWQQ